MYVRADVHACRYIDEFLGKKFGLEFGAVTFPTVLMSAVG